MTASARALLALALALAASGCRERGSASSGAGEPAGGSSSRAAGSPRPHVSVPPRKPAAPDDGDFIPVRVRDRARRRSEPASRDGAEESPWASRAACQELVAAHRTLPRRAGRARIGAWNVRWFPDGEPGRRRGKHPTDSAWLGCALAYLDADVFALEEVKGHPRARAELDDVLREAGRLTGSEFRVRLDDCQPDVAQHVALVWNTKRVKVEDFQDFGELNPLEGPCENHLRPGLGARFRFPGGLDLEVVAVHLKSGTEARSALLRERSLARLPELLARIEAEHHDADVLLAGDFNVMGCPLCAGLREGADELAKVRSVLAERERPWRVLSPKPACSHYFSRRAGLLDLMVLPADMKEVGPAAELVASGLCAELGCRPLPRELPAAYRTLSDHCPIVLDLSDQDLD